MELEIFKENGWEIRTLSKDGEPWFVGKDICDSVGDGNHRRSLSRIPSEDKGVSNVYTPGGKQEMITVNESGFYSLLFSMQPQKATSDNSSKVAERVEALNKFKRWVTHEVLPSIRKRGGYIMTSEKETEEDFNARVGKILAAAMESKELEISRYKKALALTTPAVDFRSFATKGGKEWTISDAADEFNMPMSELRSSLRTTSFFRVRVMPGGQKRWWPKERYFDCLYVKPVDGGVNYAFNARGMEWLAVLAETGTGEAMAKFELERQLDLFGEGV